MKILVINPGATSTKIGFSIDNQMIVTENYAHQLKELQQFNHINQQKVFRLKCVEEFITEQGISLDSLDAVVGRGGILPPVKAGAYEVNQAMMDYLLYETKVEHASNLGAILASEIKNKAGKETRAFIYDPVSVDEFQEVARISGLKGVPRRSLGHALNMRAVAMKVATEIGVTYQEATIIVAHLGGGNSVSIHHKGQMIDSYSDDEGPFSTERTGGLPIKEVIHLCYSHTEKEMMTLYKRAGGLLSYTGTNDARAVEAEIKKGNREFELVFQALAYQVSKAIGSLATVVAGKVNRIVLTGGLAHSSYLADFIENSTEFIAPLIVVAGEHEMVALSNGIYRVLTGQEKINQFQLV